MAGPLVQIFNFFFRYMFTLPIMLYHPIAKETIVAKPPGIDVRPVTRLSDQSWHFSGHTQTTSAPLAKVVLHNFCCVLDESMRQVQISSSVTFCNVDMAPRAAGCTRCRRPCDHLDFEFANQPQNICLIEEEQKIYNFSDGENCKPTIETYDLVSIL